jgi:hypothetical protein
MATHIKNLIKDFLKSKKAETADKGKIEEIFDGQVSLKLKKHIRLGGVEKNNLIVYSDAAAASYELNLIKGRILEGLKKDFPAVSDIKIRIG